MVGIDPAGVLSSDDPDHRAVMAAVVERAEDAKAEADATLAQLTAERTVAGITELLMALTGQTRTT